jgi:hypothetical protein
MRSNVSVLTRLNSTHYSVNYSTNVNCPVVKVVVPVSQDPPDPPVLKVLPVLGDPQARTLPPLQ